MNDLKENRVLNLKNNLIQYALNNFLNMDNFDFSRINKTSYLRKILNEKEIQKLLDSLISKIKSYKNINPYELSIKDSEEIKKIVISHLLEFDKGKYFFDKHFLKFFIDKGYLDVAEDFINRAKKEDGNLSGEEIFQAMRNVWIMNSLQIIWDMSLDLTPSIYAYSMLYPYTDNLLDNKDIDLQEKNRFNHILTKTLKGEKQISSNAYENRVFALIQDIELQYNREDFTQVYDSILLIQEAQIESLKQDQNTTMTEDDILPISFFKGGSSVLADAFLVKGNLSKEEMEFSFEYGAFLQLLDDLQDTIEDKVEGHQTIFSINVKGDLDKNILKLISYIFEVNTPNSSDSQAMVFMKEVIGSCSLIMVMDAVGRNHSLVSKKLYKNLESFSKVRLSFYKKMESQLNELNKTFNLKY
ncbi:hypothetical protein J2Z76_000142 [Sedimentibacter acidaminivorans]|uniref:Uncharacterized protein n=1 Tax=Sedimentibacter acidaminivorans TaxID=913099 RepID=A0ABS4G9E7_9FIRM|nr:hypothetical protein [Sedimentibacter acidaminivorans]MBP1924289.1 hypothetical protein [Sedimentibacter acidaminivorans]